MKHLIILFLFISSATFSQNYYPLDKAPDTTAPSNPINLTASNITQTTVILTWTAASDNVAVTNYRIYNNGAILVNTTGNVTNYLVTGLTADTLYNLTVRAIDAADNESNTSNSAVFSTNPSVVLDTQNPTAPINLTTSNITENSVNLTWTASTDNVSVAGYYIYKVNNGVSILATVGVINTYTLTGLTDSTPYSILIRAFDAAGNQSSNSNTENFTTNAIPDTQNPTTPINLVASNITQTTVDLTWTAATDNVAVTNYRIYNNGLILGSEIGNVSNYTVTGLTPGTLYNLTIRAIDAANNESSDSNAQDFTTDIPDTENPTAPLNLVASNVGNTTVDLTWTAATDNVAVTNYRIYNNDVLLINNIGNITSYTLTGLTSATLYNLTVRAIDEANNESANSNIEEITTNAPIEYASTRFIMMGSSTTYQMYYFENQIQDLINETYPDEVVNVNNEGSPGATISSYRFNQFDTALANYPYDSTIDTYVVIMLGDNNARLYPYNTLSQTAIDNEQNSLNYMLDSIESKGFKPVLLDTKFCNFQPTTTFPEGFGPAYDNENLGTKPYNDNIIIPTILSRTSTSEFAFSDGQSFMQAYTFFYNNYPAYDSGDGVHPSGAGYVAFRTHFVNTLCKYIFTGEAPTKLVKDGEQQTLPNNMPGEDDYLNAYYYPSSGSTVSGLQNAIDTYGAVRLDQGNYGQDQGPIYLNSNDKIYGYINTTLFPDVVIKQGSTNILINGINYSDITVESGATVNNNIIKNIRATDIHFSNVSFEDNSIINTNGFFNWDCSTSGYFRNNKIIKFWPQGGNPQLVWKGNDATPSYGNLQLWVNHLTSAGNTTEYDNLDNITIIGLDAEGWNLTGGGNRAMTYMRDIGDVKITDFGGGNGYSQVKTPTFDIESNNFFLLHSSIQDASSSGSIVQPNTNTISIKNRNSYNFSGTGFNFNLHGNQTLNNLYNGVSQTQKITNPTSISNIRNSLQQTQRTPIDRPNLPTIPDPTGATWASDRNGKTDSTSYIQGLIDSDGVAKLPEGIYYISSTLNLSSDEGIIGSGTGKTAIVGLTDDFPLITFSETATNKKIHLRSLTLQGGDIGLLVRPDNYSVQLMVTGQVMQDVVFRDQNYGIHLDRFFGLDNNFFENVNFINCNIGLFQEPDPNASGTQSGIMYIDKTVFYKCQIINCGIGFSMIAGRPNNLNSWIDCEFDGNGIAVDMFYNNYPIFMNCDFTNHTGNYVIGPQSPASFYSCNFSGNNTSTIFDILKVYAEGCVFSDNIPLCADDNNIVEAYLFNCDITGNLGTVDNGVLANSEILADSTINKLLVTIQNGIPTVLIDEPTNAYPQYLIKY